VLGPAAPKSQGPPAGLAREVGEVSAETRAIAKEAALSVARDARALRVANIFKVSMALWQAVSAILELVSKTQEAKSKLHGGVFILKGEMDRATELKKKAEEFASEYQHFSERLYAMNDHLWKASKDRAAAMEAADAVNGLYYKVLIGVGDLSQKMADRAEDAIDKVDRRERLAQKILDDPKAQEALAMATFGTGAVAEIVEAQADLLQISGVLGEAKRIFEGIHEATHPELDYLLSWSQWLGAVR